MYTLKKIQEKLQRLEFSDESISGIRFAIEIKNLAIYITVYSHCSNKIYKNVLLLYSLYM